MWMRLILFFYSLIKKKDWQRYFYYLRYSIFSYEISILHEHFWIM